MTDELMIRTASRSNIPLLQQFISPTASGQGCIRVRSRDNTIVLAQMETTTAEDDRAIRGRTRESKIILLKTPESGWFKLLASDGVAYDGFASSTDGLAVAIWRDWIAVGATGADLLGAVNAGAVYLYKRIGANAWEEKQILNHSSAFAYDDFGQWVAMDNGVLVVGVPRYSTDPPGYGAAFVFSLDSETDTWSETQKLQPANYQYDGFGFSVDIYDDTIVVGSTEPYAGTSGSVYVYTFDGEVWSLEDQIQPGTGSRFGVVVSLHDDTLAVLDSTANARVYTRAATVWSLEQSIPTGMGYTHSTSLYADTLAVSRYDSSDGEIKIYTRSGATWSYVQSITPDPSGEYGFFGYDVVLTSETELMVSEPEYNGETYYDLGATHRYTLFDGSWTLSSSYIMDETWDEAANNYELGYHGIAASGAYLVMCARADNENGYFAGAAWVVKL